MTIDEVSEIISKISDGIEDSCTECLQENSDTILVEITEQLYSGLDSESNYLTPDYDSDPFFNEPGYWHNRAKDYKAFKNAITPPVTSSLLGLPPRPENVPNLFITGVFYSEINGQKIDKGLMIDPGSGNGPDIVNKYGEQILGIGDRAVEYFNTEILLPWIDNFFKSCGYR